jgi:3'-phosphoadenosine 5'-phosphosulfate sulfotransferase (PAPS reductase)/FAD synthetase
MIHLAAFSGGADSTALLLWMREQGIEYTAVFCDVGWESPLTMAYVEEINQQILGGRLVVLKSRKYSRGMVDLVAGKGRVPSAKARFCTDFLKVRPMIEFIAAQNDEVTLYQGFRREESHARSCLPIKQWSEDFDCYVVRPLLDWTKDQCFALLSKHGVKPNPLYLLGAKRVGCFPCVLITHGELRRLSRSCPEIWDRMAELERHANGRSFFPPNYIPKRFQSGRSMNARCDTCAAEDTGVLANCPNCKGTGKVVTSYPTLEDVRKYVLNQEEASLFDGPTFCMSIYGRLCE